MQIVVLANEVLKEELLAGGPPSADIIWVSGPEEFSAYPGADAFIDLLFEPLPQRIGQLEALLPRPVLVNSVEKIADPRASSFTRFNGWPTLLSAPLVEAFAIESLRCFAEKVMVHFHKQVEWLPDEQGFVTARVISMIINEAYHSLEEGVSSRADMDTAMKLGTNYPYGPFEWAGKIGLPGIISLLQKMSESQAHYRPSSQMLREK